MNEKQIPLDDFQDVTEVIDDLQKFVDDHMEKVRPSQMMSLLMCEAINIMLDHAKSDDGIKVGLELFYTILRIKLGLEKRDGDEK